MLEIKPRSVPFCDCAVAVARFKPCLSRPSTSAPTLAKGDHCKFCGFFVVWKSSMMPNCNCQEINAVHSGHQIEYYQSNYDGRRKVRHMTDHKMEWLPTRVISKRTNTCAMCGGLVIWKPHKIKRAKG